MEEKDREKVARVEQRIKDMLLDLETGLDRTIEEFQVIRRPRGHAFTYMLLRH